ncbi:MAG: transposase [Anaerolineae bacterium]|nr:transposase [Anaerolineae bacterium]
MMRQSLRQALRQGFVFILQRVEQRLKHWTQPTNAGLLLGTITDMTRSKSELIAENAFLRQQLIVLRRQTKRPVLTPTDRGLLVVLASRLRAWKESLLIVKPETLLHWHRQGFRLFWCHRSKAKTGPLRIPPDVVALIKAMALDNRLWGAKRIQDELQKLGYRLSKRTVAKYMRQARRTRPPRPTGQTWATFLRNHAHDTWTCDFLQTYDLWFRAIFVFFIIELGSRRVVHFAVTRSPSDAWVAQQLREATPFGTHPRFLIRDNDSKYGAAFARAASGIEILRTPIRAPKANAVCERFLGSVRCECLDHLLIVNEQQMHRVIKEYVTYFNSARPHQGIGHRIPVPPAEPDEQQKRGAKIIAFPVLGGLHHDYRRSG